jgi:hypothetical protein
MNLSEFPSDIWDQILTRYLSDVEVKILLQSFNRKIISAVVHNIKNVRIYGGSDLKWTMLLCKNALQIQSLRTPVKVDLCPSLKSLTINGRQSRTIKDFLFLPRGLTELVITSDIKTKPLPLAKDLPRGLTRLVLPNFNANVNFLKALPDLRILKIGGTTRWENIEYLPKTLTELALGDINDGKFEAEYLKFSKDKFY